MTVGHIFHHAGKGFYEFRIVRNGTRTTKKFIYSKNGRSQEQAKEEAEEFQKTYEATPIKTGRKPLPEGRIIHCPVTKRFRFYITKDGVNASKDFSYGKCRTVEQAEQLAKEFQASYLNQLDEPCQPLPKL